MSRIQSSNIKLGSSFVFGGSSDSSHEQRHTPQVVQENEEAKKEANRLVEEAKYQASQILENANAEAQRIIDESSASIQQATQDAQAQGFEAGFADGMNKILDENSHKIQALDTLANSAFQVKKYIIQSAEKEIIDLVLQISEKVVKTKFEVEPDLIKAIVRSAISELKEKEQVKVLVNPILSSKIAEISDDLIASMHGLECIKIIEDKTVPPDGVIVESLESRIDARLSSQIAELTKSLNAEFSKNSLSEEIPDEIEILIQEPERIDQE